MPTHQVSESQGPARFARADWVFLGIVSAFGFALGLVGIWHYGYNAQDFAVHREEIRTYPRTIYYAINYSLALGWLGSLIRARVTTAHDLEAIALVFLVLNTAALWFVYRLIWLTLSRPALRYAAAAFATFVPFRVTTAVALAADAFTLPVFAVAAFCVVRLYSDPRRPWIWACLGIVLILGVLCKFSLVSLLPPTTLLVLVAIRRRLPSGGRLPWVMAASLALAPAVIVCEFQLRESIRVHGEVDGVEWLPRDMPPVMRWSDLLLPGVADFRLLSAPDYFKGKLYMDRAFSYPGLLHVASFSDVLSNFQPPPTISTDWDHRYQLHIVRDRSARSQVLQEISVRAGLVFSILALTGLAFASVGSMASLVTGRPLVPDAVCVLTLLAISCYGQIFLSLPQLRHPYPEGYWLPRLVIPSLLVFFLLGFFLVERAAGLLERRGRPPGPFLVAFAGYTFAACLIFCGFLV
jgi:hypothetical protein